MIINIAVCDDDNQALYSYVNLLISYGIAKDIDFNISDFKSGTELIKSYSHNKRYDIILLDIEMATINGIETAATIRSNYDRNVIIVFISNYPNYMLDSFSVHPYNFLKKPITIQQFNNLFDDIISSLLEKISFLSIIQSDYNEIRINVRDILYINTENAKKKLISFHMVDNIIPSKGTISQWEERLSSFGFYLCYKGILINISHVHYINNNQIFIDNGESLPLSRIYYKKINDIFFNTVISIKNN